MSEGTRGMTLHEWMMLLVLSMFWGGSFFFIGVAVRGLPTFTIVAARVVTAALVLLAALRISRVQLPREPAVLRALATMALLNNVIPFSLIVWGQSHIASGLASILNATTPLFTVIVAHVATADERITPARLAGVLTGIAGVVVIVGRSALGGVGAYSLAQLAVLVAAFSYALAGVFGRRLRRMGVQPLAAAAGQLTASSLILVPLALLIDRPWMLPTPSAQVIGAVVGLALLSTALSYVIYFRLLATAGATNLLLVTLLIPVSGLLLGSLVLGETILPRQLAGMVLIASGLGCIDGRPIRWLGRAFGRA